MKSSNLTKKSLQNRMIDDFSSQGEEFMGEHAGKSPETSDGKQNVVDDYDDSMNGAGRRLTDIKEELESEFTNRD